MLSAVFAVPASSSVCPAPALILACCLGRSWSRMCIPWAVCAVMKAPVLFPVCPHIFPGYSLVSWGAPTVSPACSRRSCGFSCCLYAKTHHPMTSAQTCPPVKLRIRHVGCHELLRKLSLVYLLCSLAISLQTNGWIASTSRLKHLHATNSFGLKGACSAPVALLGASSKPSTWLPPG